MSYMMKKSLADEMRKSLDPKMLYFKKKILDHLKKLGKKEDKEKSSLKKSLIIAETMAKGGAGLPVGTIRVWKGKKYIKIAPGKWKPKYDSNTRGAKMAIAALKKKLEACETSEEMLQLVLANRSRFSDEVTGRPLPFVQELADYVSSLNDKKEKKPGKNKEVKATVTDSQTNERVISDYLGDKKGVGDRIKEGNKETIWGNDYSKKHKLEFKMNVMGAILGKPQMDQALFDELSQYSMGSDSHKLAPKYGLRGEEFLALVNKVKENRVTIVNAEESEQEKEGNKYSLDDVKQILQSKNKDEFIKMMNLQPELPSGKKYYVDRIAQNIIDTYGKDSKEFDYLLENIEPYNRTGDTFNLYAIKDGKVKEFEQIEKDGIAFFKRNSKENIEFIKNGKIENINGDTFFITKPIPAPSEYFKWNFMNNEEISGRFKVLKDKNGLYIKDHNNNKTYLPDTKEIEAEKKEELKESETEKHANRSKGMKGNQNAKKDGSKEKKSEKNVENTNSALKGTNIEKVAEKYANDKIIKSTVSKISENDVVSDDFTRAIMCGTYQEDGYKIATDGRLLTMIKSDYPESEEKQIKVSDKYLKSIDKTIENKNSQLAQAENEIKSMQRGMMDYIRKEDEIKALKEDIANLKETKETGKLGEKYKFPQYKRVIPSMGSSTLDNVTSDFADRTKLMKIAKTAAAYQKAYDLNVPVKVGNKYYDCNLLLTALAMAEKHGLNEVFSREGDLTPVEFKGENGSIVLMPGNFKSEAVFDGTTGNAKLPDNADSEEFLSAGEKETSYTKQRKMKAAQSKMVSGLFADAYNKINEIAGIGDGTRKKVKYSNGWISADGNYGLNNLFGHVWNSDQEAKQREKWANTYGKEKADTMVDAIREIQDLNKWVRSRVEYQYMDDHQEVNHSSEVENYIKEKGNKIKKILGIKKSLFDDVDFLDDFEDQERISKSVADVLKLF